MGRSAKAWIGVYKGETIYLHHEDGEGRPVTVHKAGGSEPFEITWEEWIEALHARS